LPRLPTSFGSALPNRNLSAVPFSNRFPRGPGFALFRNGAILFGVAVQHDVPIETIAVFDHGCDLRPPHMRVRDMRAVPAYLSRASLAEQLDCAVSTVDELVKRGVLPKPFHLSSGCVRWRWADVEVAIGTLNGATERDPYLAGVNNATKID
jgi:predicted DNA-binding transcriptional regulator AlpA